MERTAKKLEAQIQFWTLIGPILIVMTLLAVMIRGEPRQWALSCVAILGIPFCWKWKMRGLALSIGLLVIVFLYQMIEVSFDGRFWISALTVTIATTFVVTALSFEEAKDVIRALEIESKSRLDNLFTLDEKFKELQSSFQKERDLLIAKITQSQQDLEEKQQQVFSYEKIVGIAKGEILATQQKQEKLLQEVFDKRQEAVLLQQRIEELQINQQAVVVQEDRTEEIADLQKRLEQALEEVQSSHKQIEEYALELASLKEMNESQDKISLRAQEEQILHQAIVQEMNDHLEGLLREKNLLEHTLARLQTELDSMHVQEEQKTQTIELQLHNIQTLKTNLEKRDEELRDEKKKYEDQKVVLENKLKILSGQVDELTSKWSHSTQQISLWQQRIADYELLREKLASQQSLIQSITESHGVLLKELEEKNLQLQILQSTSEKSTPSEPLSIEDERTIARVEAMYLQLREQFEEKSSVLDATRRELFKTQESLLLMQKEIEENHVYDINESEAKLQDLLLSMEKELSEKETVYQNEIQALHHVISALV